MCRGDGMEITSEMQVHIFHGNDLGIAAASSAALHTKAGAKAGFTDTDHGFLTDSIQPVTQTHSCCGLAFTGRCGVNRRYQNQLTIGPV